jgi:hypothetical protein
MLEHGAPVNAAALDGTTALMMAAMANPTTTVLKTLIEHGADVNAKNNRGVTAVMMASIDPFRTDKIDLLVRSGADINAQDAAGMTALMHAFTAYIREENIKTLLSLGADTTIQDKRGRDVRFYAATKEGKGITCHVRAGNRDTKPKCRDGTWAFLRYLKVDVPSRDDICTEERLFSQACATVATGYRPKDRSFSLSA